MITDVVEVVKSYFTSSLVAQVSTLVGEAAPDVSRTLHKSVVLVLHHLLRRLEGGFAPEVLLHVVRAADTAQVLGQLSDPTKQSVNLLFDLVGDTLRTLEQEVALGTSIRPAASGLLLRVAAAAVAGVLGQEFRESNSTPVEFANWLGTQRAVVQSALLRMAIRTALAPRPETAPQPAQEPAEEPLARSPQVPKIPLATAAVPSPPAGREEPPYSPSVPFWLRWQWGLLLLAALALGYFLGSAWLG